MDEQAQGTVSLTWTVAEHPDDNDAFNKWYQRVHHSEAKTLVEVTAGLSSEPGKKSRELKALREAVLAEINCKNSDRIIETMTKLDASAGQLTRIGTAIAIIGVLVSVLQIMQTALAHR
jgi:hypothetical protein